MQQILVKNANGVTCAVDVPACASVQEVKTIVMMATGEVSMDAGGKKKKKKVYTTPKKIKHKNKKIKMRVLNYYNITGTEITRTKLECERCGAGCFMATHADRYTCGRCQRTLAAKH